MLKDIPQPDRTKVLKFVNKVSECLNKFKIFYNVKYLFYDIS